MYILLFISSYPVPPIRYYHLKSGSLSWYPVLSNYDRYDGKDLSDQKEPYPGILANST